MDGLMMMMMMMMMMRMMLMMMMMMMLLLLLLLLLLHTMPTGGMSCVRVCACVCARVWLAVFKLSPALSTTTKEATDPPKTKNKIHKREWL